MSGKEKEGERGGDRGSGCRSGGHERGRGGFARSWWTRDRQRKMVKTGGRAGRQECKESEERRRWRGGRKEGTGEQRRAEEKNNRANERRGGRGEGEEGGEGEYIPQSEPFLPPRGS